MIGVRQNSVTFLICQEGFKYEEGEILNAIRMGDLADARTLICAVQYSSYWPHGLFKLKLLTLNRMKKFSSSIALANSKHSISNMKLVATVLGGRDVEHFHHCRKVFGTILTQKMHRRRGGMDKWRKGTIK